MQQLIHVFIQGLCIIHEAGFCYSELNALFRNLSCVSAGFQTILWLSLFSVFYFQSVIFDEIQLLDVSIAECSVKNVNHSFQVSPSPEDKFHLRSSCEMNSAPE